MKATGQASVADGRWDLDLITVKERRLTLGRQYRIFSPDGRLLAYCKQKMFKLREDIRFFADESQQHELFRLSTRKILDFNANLEVVESATGRVLGSIRRKGWRSLLRDKWEVYDPNGNLLGLLEEDSWLLASIRRFLLGFLPMGYTLSRPDGPAVATVHERFQMFGDTYDLRVNDRTAIDPRVLVGLTVCLDALEEE
jgi:uncharacterized protein YxjI